MKLENRECSEMRNNNLSKHQAKQTEGKGLSKSSSLVLGVTEQHNGQTWIKTTNITYKAGL